MINFKFKKLDKPAYSSDPYYDLVHGGYIQPFKMLEDPKQAKKVWEAVQVLEAFLNQAEAAGALEYY